jgi:hypothetical protein
MQPRSPSSRARRSARPNRPALERAVRGVAPLEALESRQLFAAANPLTVDMFVAYDAGSRQAIGDTQRMLDKIDRMSAFFNQALATSRVGANVRLVGTMETPYVGTSDADAEIEKLRNTTDGAMDDVTNAAAVAGADIVVVVSNTISIGGIAEGNLTICSYQEFMNGGILNHEGGHVFGAGHNRSTVRPAENVRAKPYAYEFFQQFGDKFYAGATAGSLPFWSSPDIIFRGKPMGVAGTGPDAADNSRAMRERAPVLAATRAPVVADTKGPAAALRSMQAPTGQNFFTFRVSYYDDSGVNVDTLGNGNVRVTGPNGFNQLATFVDVNDPSTNYANKMATYRVNTPGPVGDLAAYSFALEPNSVRDTTGNAAPAGPIGGPSAKVNDYAGDEFSTAAEEGDLVGRTWRVTDEIGGRYKNGMDTARFRFSLSTPASLTIVRPDAFIQLWNDANGNLSSDPGEVVRRNGDNTYPVLPAGDNYYFEVMSGVDPKIITFSVTASGQAPALPPTPPATPAQPVSIAGAVFSDTNNDGIKQANEPGIGGVKLTLTGTDDLGAAVNIEATTAPDGSYVVNSPRPSNAAGFTLTQTQPANYTQGTNRVGNGGGTLNGDAVGGIVLLPGQNVVGYTFGEIASPASVRGFVYTDANGNADKDTGEAGIAGVVVRLTGTNDAGAAVDLTATTNAAGEYVFNNLRPSNAAGYTITETQPPGIPQGQNKVGSLGGTQGNDTFTGVPVGPGAAGVNYLFGEGAAVQPSSLSGFVFIDLNNDGIKQDNEQGIQGVFITLTGTNDLGVPEVRGVATRADGSYTLSQLRPANAAGYKLEQSQPANVIDGIDTAGSAGGTVNNPKNTITGIKLPGSTAAAGYNFAEQPLPAQPPAPPVVNDGNTTTPENTPVDGDVFGDGAGPRPGALSVNGTPLLYAQLIEAPKHAATFTLNRDGTYSYLPEAFYNGPDFFIYQGVDENGRVAQARVDINVTPVDQPPELSDEVDHVYLTVQTVSVDIDLRHTAEDPDGNPLTFSLAKVVGGTAKLLSDGCTIRFTPDRNFVGVGSITYVCSDGVNPPTPLVVTVCVTPYEQAPVARNDSAQTLPGSEISINALANDFSPDGDTMCFTSVGQPANGKVRIDTRGTADPHDDRIVYKPNFGFHGTETFTYVLRDFGGGSTTASVTVTVKPGAGLANDPSDWRKSALDVYGTPGNDVIKLTQQQGRYLVTMNGVLLGSYTPSGAIGIFGGGGNDTIDASGVDRPVMLFGDDGNDKLIGGKRNDVLVGGRGADSLNGGDGDDRLIAGTAAYATAGFGPLLNLFSSTAPLGSYARDDAARDTLVGGNGADRFWARSTGGGVLDLLSDRKSAEAIVQLN